MALRVNEIFESIQGEGTHSGRACFFLRLQGCSVGCKFCDEKKTWRAEQGTVVEEAEILERFYKLNPDLKYATITGGEPCEQDLGALLGLLDQNGFSTAIETSGTGAYAEKLAQHQGLWITLSPKELYSANAEISDTVWQRASEIKFVVSRALIAESPVKEGSGFDLNIKKYIGERLRPWTSTKAVYLVPDFYDFETNRDLALKLCRESAGRLKLGLQAHKYWGIS